MTLHNTDESVERLQHVRDNTLQENYEPHELGVTYLTDRLTTHGLSVTPIGDKDPESDTIKYSDGKPDLRVTGPGSGVEYVDVKTKRYRDGAGEQWFRRLNQRHFNDYLLWQDGREGDVFLWFALVEEDASLIHRHGFIRVNGQSQVEQVIPDVKGNDVVQLVEQDLRAVPWFAHQVRSGH